MPPAQSQRTPDELARLGAEILDRQIRPSLQPEDDRKFIAIDIASGEYELDEDDYAAVSRLQSRCPNAEIWLGRVGEATAYRLGRRR